MKRVAVSACLLGEDVRYDGGNKLDAGVRALLNKHGLDGVRFCPEQTLGIPRPPIELTTRQDGSVAARIKGTGQPVSHELEAAIRRIAQDLLKDQVDGVICKSRSPSCALGDAPRADTSSEGETSGAGLFILHFRLLVPQIPIIDEVRLAETTPRRDFLRAIGIDSE